MPAGHSRDIPLTESQLFFQDPIKAFEILLENFLHPNHRRDVTNNETPSDPFLIKIASTHASG